MRTGSHAHACASSGAGTGQIPGSRSSTSTAKRGSNKVTLSASAQTVLLSSMCRGGGGRRFKLQYVGTSAEMASGARGGGMR